MNVASPQPPRGAGRGTALLVEDDGAVRDLIARHLARLGFQVLVARDGAEALRLARERGGQPLALLVTDVVMPGLSGPRLARALAEERPGLRTLFVSGYARDAETLREVLDSGARLLGKPFGLADLARAIDAVLGET